MNMYDDHTILREIFKNETTGSKVEVIEVNQEEYILKTSNLPVNSEYYIMSILSNEYIAKPLCLISMNSYVMPFYPKGSIPDRKAFQKSDLKNLFHQMCKSVEYLHGRDFCHLDLKLPNFVLTDEGSVKLIDFAHATKADKNINKVYGSNEYNGPERGQRPYDGKKADIFSLGICLIKMLTGISPLGSHDEKKFQNFRTNTLRFWAALEGYLNKNKKHPDPENGLDQDAKDLLFMMLDEIPENRPTIAQVLQHNFFKVSKE